MGGTERLGYRIRAGAKAPPRSPASWRVLVPGLPQWGWHEREHAALYFGTYVSALLVGVCGWGTWVGSLMLLIAPMVHVLSVIDALRRSLISFHAGLVPITVVSSSILMVGYAPIGLTTWMVAYPDRGNAGECFLVNRWAFRHSEPGLGDHVWSRERNERPELVRIVAQPGDAVELIAGTLRVNNRELVWTRRPIDDPLQDLAMVVPDDHVLVLGAPADGARLRLVSRAAIVGQVWFQQYPISRRGWLDPTQKT
jgi:hypothetical protein